MKQETVRIATCSRFTSRQSSVMRALRCFGVLMFLLAVDLDRDRGAWNAWLAIAGYGTLHPDRLPDEPEQEGLAPIR
jgi:hypothetical protein